MIRNVVLARVRDEPGALDEASSGLAGIAALDLPGLLANHVGLDEGLRPGGWTLAITNDWADAAAYQHYDADPEHNRYRQQIVAACTEVARVQFEIPGGG